MLHDLCIGLHVEHAIVGRRVGNRKVLDAWRNREPKDDAGLVRAVSEYFDQV